MAIVIKLAAYGFGDWRKRLRKHKGFKIDLRKSWKWFPEFWLERKLKNAGWEQPVPHLWTRKGEITGHHRKNLPQAAQGRHYVV